MPFAFVHLIGAWLAGKGYEYFAGRKIGRRAWFFLLLGGILPDADFLLDWTLGWEVHRGLSHSFIFVAAAALLVFLIYRLQNSPEDWQLALALGAGIITHLSLDFFSQQGIALFWPNQLYYSYLRIGAYNPELAFLKGTSSLLVERIKLAVLDMALGVSWIFYLWYKKKIEF